MTRAERRRNDPEVQRRAQRYIQSSGGGYGLGNPNARIAQGEHPSVNPFVLPKDVGLSAISYLYPNQYYVEWDLSTWRSACDQAVKMGFPVSYATLVSWCYEASPFVRSLFNGIEVAVSKIPVQLVDDRGNPLEEWNKELTSKRWFWNVVKEIALSKFWGFSCLNIDPINNKTYKYPMQQIDPINEMLRRSTFDFQTGMYISEHANLLFIQPSSSYEELLGWMQPIARSFIQMNLMSNNWLSAGKRLAFPLFTLGYPQNDNQMVKGVETNVFKAQAEAIAANIDPSKAVVFPYTKDAAGNIQKAIEIEFESPGGGTGMWRVYSDFNTKQQDEIREMIYNSTLTSNNSSTGSYSLGKVHENKYESVIQYIMDWVIFYLNDEFKKKISLWYKNFPADAVFSLNKSKEWTIDEIVALAPVVRDSGKKFSAKFFEKIGLPEDFLEESRTPFDLPFQEEESFKEPETEIAVDKKRSLFAFKKKKIVQLGREYLHHNHYHHLASKKDKKPIISNLKVKQDDEMKYAYENPKKKAIYEPMYSSYNKAFFDKISEKMNIKDSFEKLRNTDFWEKYMLNSFQFSAAKNRSEMKELQKQVFDENKTLRSFSQFKEAAQPIVDIFNETWMRTEYDLASHGAVMADRWERIQRDKDINPYVIYRTMDSPCEICEPLDGMTFKVDDIGEFYPPNHFNCLKYNTLIITNKGEKRICDLKIGDLVLTRLGYKPVKNVFKNGIKKVKLYTIGNKSIVCTEEHRFFIDSKFIQIKSVDRKASHIFSFIENNEVKKHECFVNWQWHNETSVYDIEVEDTHEYFANGILVHNCECTVETTDDIDEADLASDDEIEEKLKNIPEDFRGNVGEKGIFPNNSSYFDVLPSANDADYEMFSINIENLTQLNSKTYTDYQVMLAMDKWKNPEHKDIIFRNQEWMLNVRLTQETLNKIGKKTRGFENIKHTVEHPAEVWGRWVDAKRQNKVILNYITFDGKNAYIVETIDGEIVNAYYRQHTDSKNLRRSGIKFIK